MSLASWYICWYLNKILKMKVFAGTLAYSIPVLEESSKLKANLSLLFFKSQLHLFVLLPYKCQLCRQ